MQDERPAPVVGRFVFADRTTGGSRGLGFPRPCVSGMLSGRCLASRAAAAGPDAGVAELEEGAWIRGRCFTISVRRRRCTTQSSPTRPCASIAGSPRSE